MGTKISEFAAATTPLTGAELVPIVQGGSTLKTTVSAFSTLAPVQSVAGRTGAVVIATTDVTGFTAAAAAAAPVQTVAGRTGAVTLGISDVASLQTTLDGKLSTSGGAISANSSTDAVRITQTGTGNALVVEDSTNPDATPFVVTADGNVGIGTTTPYSQLAISGGVDAYRFSRNLYYDGTNWRYVSNGFATQINQGVGGTTNGIIAFETAANNTSGQGALASVVERMRITPDGNIGIGTSAPNSALHVNGDITLYGKQLLGSITGSTNGGCGLTGGNSFTNGTGAGISVRGITATYNPGGVDFYYASGGATLEAMRITSTGNVGIGTSAPTTYGKLAVTGADDASLLGLGSTNGVLRAKAYNTATSSPSIEATNAAQSGYANLFLGGLNVVLGSGTTERMRVDASGNVGIGTSAPARLLSLSGSNATLGITSTSAGGGTVAIDPPSTAASGIAQLDISGANSFRINTNSGERMRFDALGNVGIGATTFGANAFRVLGFANGTAPTTSPAGMGQLYVENGALKYRGSSGTVTTIANA